MLDLRILNGTVLTEDAVQQVDIGIEDGRIASLDPTGASGPARQEVDATGLHVLPGAIDVHFHCRAPSHPHRGDFGSETRAAAAGGVTTIFEMPISDPSCSTPEVFRARRALAESEAFVNFGLYSGAALSKERATEMAELGAIGFKLFTIAPAAGREREFDGVWATDEGAIFDALEAVSDTGLRCVVHAENERLVRYFEARADNGAIPARPPIIEAVAIASVAALAKEAGARIHIAHVSSRDALSALRTAVASDTDVSGETCPQYLVLDSRAIEKYGGVAKIGPPLRESGDQDALWAAVADGTLSVVSSDHSPFQLSEKNSVAYRLAPQGLPSVELLVPVVLDAVARGVLPLARAVALVTSAPARLFGLAPRQGRLALGADADIAIAALGVPYRPGPAILNSRGADCAIVFTGLTLQARVEKTIVNGTVVYDEGRFLGGPRGRFAVPVLRGEPR
jgi:dihydroorotase (multifunctional complex type)